MIITKNDKNKNTFRTLLINICFVISIFYYLLVNLKPLSGTPLKNLIYILMFGIVIVFYYFLFMRSFIYKKSYYLPQTILLWIPYLLITIIGLLLDKSLMLFCYWAICLFFVFYSSYKGDLIDYSSLTKISVYISIFIMISIVIQIFFSSFYKDAIKFLFVDDVVNLINFWENGGYYGGFSSQPGISAVIILCSLACVFCFDYKHKYAYSLLCIVFIFLTGKRALFLISIVAPITTSLLFTKYQNDRIKYFLIVVVVLLIAVLLISSNGEIISQIGKYGRLNTTLDTINREGDISSGRMALYNIAIENFKEKPIFGIGVNRFLKDVTTAEVHNSFLKLLCEQGLVGFILFIIPLIVCFFETVKLSRVYQTPPLKFSIFIQLFYIMYSFTGNTLSDMFSIFLYFIGISILNNQLLLRRKEL